MPKKTKKQKILAEARRIIRESQLQKQQAVPVNNVKSEPVRQTEYQFIKPQPKNNSRIQIETDPREFALIRKDLIKTVALAAGAIVIELIIFWKF